jgi:predicted GIY-YIG superfamily endonuclease
MMQQKRNTYKYHFMVGNEIVYSGVTSDLKRREAEHKVRWPDGYIVQVGSKTTRKGALDWQRKIEEARYGVLN